MNMTYDQAQAQRRRNSTVLNAFLPQTLDERMSKLRDRMRQAWPTFGRSGLGDEIYSALHIQDHDTGTIVRFFSRTDPVTFDPVGAVKHGAYWYLSEKIEDKDRLTNKEMQAYLIANELNWVALV